MVKTYIRNKAFFFLQVVEACADQGGETPEDVAWNVFRCGYDKKAVLFEYMPTNVASTDMENNSE